MDVVVVGSINRDISVLTPELPQPGETVLGREHFFGSGGKGSNQAVAIARLGGSVGIIGRVGNDDMGADLVSGLEAEGVDTTMVSIDPSVASGLAVISIDDAGENSIVVSPGANWMLTPAHVAEHASVVRRSAVVLAQLEVPTDAVARAARHAEGTFVLNPAPVSPLTDDLLTSVDVLVPNRTELGSLAAVDTPRTAQEAARTAHMLRFDGAVVVTLGSEGALLVHEGDDTLYPAPDVEVVDTTGAGDAFCGAFASTLAKGASVERAVERAVVASAISVTARGAQTALPSAAQVEGFIGG